MTGTRWVVGALGGLVVLAGCAIGGQQCATSMAGCAGLVEVSGKTWNPVGAKRGSVAT